MLHMQIHSILKRFRNNFFALLTTLVDTLRFRLEVLDNLINTDFILPSLECKKMSVHNPTICCANVVCFDDVLFSPIFINDALLMPFLPGPCEGYCVHYTKNTNFLSIQLFVFWIACWTNCFLWYILLFLIIITMC